MSRYFIQTWLTAFLNIWQLCDLAQYWANHLAHTDDFYYRKFRDVGENLLCRWSYVPDFDITGWASFVSSRKARSAQRHCPRSRPSDTITPMFLFVLSFAGEQVARYWYSEIKYYDFFLDPSILHVQAGKQTEQNKTEKCRWGEKCQSSTGERPTSLLRNRATKFLYQKKKKFFRL